MIFPYLGPEYYNEKHRDVLSFMEAFYSNAVTINMSFWGEADLDTRFEAGDQNVWYDVYGNLPAARRNTYNFNRIRRVINMIDGHQRRNRKSTIVTPIENADQETADQFTKILAWAAQQEGIYETISEAFHGSLVTGMNMLQVWVDYRQDPISGTIKVDNCDYNSFLIDPYFRKHDLSDCNAIWKRTYVSKPEAISLLPGKEEEILAMSAQDNGDGKFQFMPESYNYGLKNLLTYDEFYYRSFREQQLLVDTQTGETFEWKAEDKDALKRFLSQYPQIELIKNEIPTVRLAIVVQNKVLYDGPNLLGIDSYPFIPVLAYYEPQMPYYPNRIQGVVRGLRDAQYLYNRRRVIELDILESQLNSGWVYKENSLVNPKDVFLSGQGKGLALKQEASMADVQRIEAPQVPPSMIQLSELLAQEVSQISGVNEELLGSAVDDKAGILSMLRQGAGLTTLQRLFDQLDFSQKLLGKIMIELIQTNFTPGKVQKIIHEQPSPQFYNKLFGKYDAVVEEGFNTSTQRQMQFAQLLHLREAGVPVPDNVLVECATLQNKNQLIEALSQQAQQAQQAQQMQLQAAMAEQQARIELAQSRAEADRGLGAERYSRIQENAALAVERRAEADKDRDIGLLNMVKAIKELEDLDIQAIEKLVTLANMIKSNEANRETPNQTPVQPV